MFALSATHRYLLYSQPTDMRKSFDALCGIVRNQLNRDPLNGEVFIFLNRSRSHLKLLHWERGGLVLYYKRLEKGTFTPPLTNESAMTISYAQLVLMTEGIIIGYLFFLCHVQKGRGKPFPMAKVCLRKYHGY